jgi:hypothetical protein
MNIRCFSVLFQSLNVYLLHLMYFAGELRNRSRNCRRGRHAGTAASPPPHAPRRGASSVRTPIPQQDGPSEKVPIGRSPPWRDDETLFLIAERGAREYKREAGPSLGKLRETKKQRDEGLAKCLNDKGFGPRTGAQVNNRWDVIRTGYTKIND